MVVRRNYFRNLYISTSYMCSINYTKFGRTIYNQNLGGFKELNRILKIK